MSNNYDIKTETVSKGGNLLNDAIYLFTGTTVDTYKKEEVTTVTDKDTGNTVTFDNKEDAMEYVSKNSK